MRSVPGLRPSPSPFPLPPSPFALSVRPSPSEFGLRSSGPGTGETIGVLALLICLYLRTEQRKAGAYRTQSHINFAASVLCAVVRTRPARAEVVCVGSVSPIRLRRSKLNFVTTGSRNIFGLLLHHFASDSCLALISDVAVGICFN
jgi:hypothetical protein